MSELGGVARFSTDAVPLRDRMGIWHDFFGRTIVGVDMMPADDEPLRFDMINRDLQRLAVATGHFSGYSANRTRELLADNKTGISLLMPGRSHFVACQRGREVALGEGQAVLMSMSETGYVEQAATAISNMPYMHIDLPRQMLAPLVPDLDDLILTVVSERNEALRLLRNYVGLINNGDRLVTEHTAHSVSSHILDLAVLAIGGSADARVEARRRGLGAARLASIKAYVRAHAGDPGLTVTEAARYAGISPAYIWKLFASEGGSFSSYLLEQRLGQAWRMLTSSDHGHLRISAIAYKTGFGDLSYFNRSFRRRYGMTPSDARAVGLDKSES